MFDVADSVKCQRPELVLADVIFKEQMENGTKRCRVLEDFPLHLFGLKMLDQLANARTQTLTNEASKDKKDKIE